jgi:hypothetical protein
MAVADSFHPFEVTTELHQECEARRIALLRALLELKGPKIEIGRQFSGDVRIWRLCSRKFQSRTSRDVEGLKRKRSRDAPKFRAESLEVEPSRASFSWGGCPAATVQGTWQGKIMSMVVGNAAGNQWWENRYCRIWKLTPYPSSLLLRTPFLALIIFLITIQMLHTFIKSRLRLNFVGESLQIWETTYVPSAHPPSNTGL